MIITLDNVDKVTNSTWALEEVNGYALPSPCGYQQKPPGRRSEKACPLWHFRISLVILVCIYLESSILPLEDSWHFVVTYAEASRIVGNADRGSNPDSVSTSCQTSSFHFTAVRLEIVIPAVAGWRKCQIKSYVPWHVAGAVPGTAPPLLLWAPERWTVISRKPAGDSITMWHLFTPHLLSVRCCQEATFTPGEADKQTLMPKTRAEVPIGDKDAGRDAEPPRNSEQLEASLGTRRGTGMTPEHRGKLRGAGGGAGGHSLPRGGVGTKEK